MKDRPVLIQAGFYSHKILLDLVRDYHTDYCHLQGIDYWDIDHREDHTRAPNWDRIPLILEAFRRGYPLAIWLDADCLIMKPEKDIRTALSPDAEIGMVHFGPPYATLAHYNTGAMWLRRTPAVLRLLERAWSKWPVGTEWEDQSAINMALFEDLSLKIQHLDERWNCVPVFPLQNPVIRAWHGNGSAENRLKYMREALESISR